LAVACWPPLLCQGHDTYIREGALPKPAVSAPVSAPKLTKRSLQSIETQFEKALSAYVISVRFLGNAASALVTTPTSKRRLDAVLQARVREVEARRAYQRASKALFNAILTKS
jgi:hypothetical protein